VEILVLGTLALIILGPGPFIALVLGLYYKDDIIAALNRMADSRSQLNEAKMKKMLSEEEK
jgi:hypothetical protein